MVAWILEHIFFLFIIGLLLVKGHERRLVLFCCTYLCDKVERYISAMTEPELRGECGIDG